MDATQFAELVRAKLEEVGQTPYRAAVSHRLPRDAFRYVLSGRTPRFDRVAQICDALGLELYVGPPRLNLLSGAATTGVMPIAPVARATRELVRLVCEAGEDPIPDDLWPVLIERRRSKEGK